ncbi:hypothetical protein [Aquidulcibacter sp.]|uniref:hypothetical protein n=1 Tax=Aquidulcibacter sp. TaxID=2052990 RepID=UPI0037849B31
MSFCDSQATSNHLSNYKKSTNDLMGKKMEGYDNAAMAGLNEIIEMAVREFQEQPAMQFQAEIWQQEYSFSTWQSQKDPS